jgi:hypothetical protein
MVDDRVVAVISPWLNAALTTGRRLSVVLPAIAHLSASAKVTDAALRVNLWRPVGAFRAGRPHLGKATLMATFGVASDPVTGARLWTSLLEEAGLPWREPPDSPWCGVLPAPEDAADFRKTLHWLPELQAGIAFAWLSGDKTAAHASCTADCDPDRPLRGPNRARAA